jgi:beta-lactamase superfamily II metal-dependent hydrolase
MSDFIEIDFLGVETSKSGDAITTRYSVNGVQKIHVVDGGYVDTGDQIIAHLKAHYGTTRVDNVVLTHPDQDHANGLRKVLEECSVGVLWMNRPWLYAEELIDRFETYKSVEALKNKLRSVYSATAALEEIAIEKGIPIFSPLQGSNIGEFVVLAPTKERYLDLVVASEKTPEAARESVVEAAMEGIGRMFKAASSFVRALWGDEYFPADGTSSENEMSVVQYIKVNERNVVLTGDAGREALAEAADYAPFVGLQLPGNIWTFQVPHHGGRHNVDTEILDRWLGDRMSSLPTNPSWNAICSSAEADQDHPRKSVVRAMLHRGAHFAATEGRTLSAASGISRSGWSSVPQATYPEEQEN